MSDPAALAAAFERIARTRMRDMPLCNPALRVETLEFRPWQGGNVGALVTPWCINLVLLPDPPAVVMAADGRRTVHFPSGSYEFMGSEAPECGSFLFCPLYSPPEEFVSQSQAQEVCREVMKQLFQPTQVLSRRSLIVAPPAITAGVDV
jgi:[NiFe] hydrogenase assembly HybE family chaperone